MAVNGGRWKRGDLRRWTICGGAFETWRPSAVMDFARPMRMWRIDHEPLKYYETNVGGTAKLLAA